jgi:heat shock protein HtpX
MKRILLLLLTNIAVIVTLGVVASIFGVNQFLIPHGINYTNLLGFAFVFGFGGAFISLLISKVIAKWTMGLTLITGTENEQYNWLYKTIENQAMQVGISMPEVAIYDSVEMNAFATGPTKNNALVAVSTGLLAEMKRFEVEAVLGHEVTHIANGDMVTQTLLQGILNTFVIFAARIIGYFIDQFIFGGGKAEDDYKPGIGYAVISFLLEIIFGIVASMIVAWYSRRREYAADSGGATLAGRQNMISALYRLGGNENELKGGLNAFGISGNTHSFFKLFATHPDIEDRIKALTV